MLKDIFAAILIVVYIYMAFVLAKATLSFIQNRLINKLKDDNWIER